MNSEYYYYYIDDCNLIKYTNCLEGDKKDLCSKDIRKTKNY